MTDAEFSYAVEESIRKKFHRSIFSKFTKSIVTYDLLQPGDKVAVCISGGKDSMLMAMCIKQLSKYTKIPFTAEFLVMDPGYAPAQLGRTELLRRMGNFPAFFAGMESFIRNEDVRPDIKSHYLTALMDNIDSPFYWVWGETIRRLVDIVRRLHRLVDAATELPR